MPELLQRTGQSGNAPAGSISAVGIWSLNRENISFDLLQKFWSELPLQSRQELLRIDKHTLFEQARKNLYCSRCNGLLLEVFTQIVMYGKSLQQEGVEMHLFNTMGVSKNHNDGELDLMQDPLVHPWGGLATTKDGMLTCLDGFISSRSLKALKNVFDNARARERERELLYPDACGGGGRGWISQGMANYGRGHGTREACALHTARLSCDTLADFWSALGDETRLSLLRMKEEDFIEKLMYRFDSKRFCRDCRRNVIREFKELKELKRMRREPRCTNWFCVADTAFQYEVSEDTVQADWHQSFTDTIGTYHHFEWAVGTAEGKSDILDFEDVGMSGSVQMNGLDLSDMGACYITLRAWKLDGRCTELCVKAHALKGHECVHRRLMVGDGFVTITKGGNIRKFFEHAEEAEEEEEDDAIDKDGNELDGDCSRPQKHAKSPELAREFLLDAAAIIFKEQVEKAFREGTARQNAHSIFVCLAIKLLEERLQVACKEIITLEKQTKLLEEEEREKREEEERKERRRAKEREKKLRRKERLQGKERERERKVIGSKPSCDVSFTSLNDSPSSTMDDSPNTPDSGDSISDQGDIAELITPLSPDITDEQSPSGSINKNISFDNLEHQCHMDGELNARDDGTYSFVLEQSKSSRRKLRFRKESIHEQISGWYDSHRSVISIEHSIQQDESGTVECTTASRNISGLHKLSRERLVKNNSRNCNLKFSEKLHNSNSRMRDRYDFHSCNCSQQGDYRIKDGYHIKMARSGREIKTANKTAPALDTPRPFHRSIKYNHICYPSDSSVASKGMHAGGTPNKDVLHTKQVWEPMDTRKKSSRNSLNITLGNSVKVDPSEDLEANANVNGFQQPQAGLESHDDLYSSEHSGTCRKVDTFNSHQVCQDRGKNSGTCQFGTYNGSQNGFAMITKSDCFLKNGGEEEEVDSGTVPLSNNSDPVANSGSSDNCSSCLSEGDSNSSSSSSSLTAQNAESSSTSDSEDSTLHSDGRDTSACSDKIFRKYPHESSVRNNTDADGSMTRTPAGSPPRRCTKFHLSEEDPRKAVHSSNYDRLMVDMAPSQHLLPVHNQNMQIPIFPSPTLGYHNQASWSASTNGLLPYAQPDNFPCPSPFGYGLAATQPSESSLDYSTLRPSATSFYSGRQSLYRPGNRINSISPKEQYRSTNSCGNLQISATVEPIGNRRSIESPFLNMQLPTTPQSMGQSGSIEKAAKLNNGNPSFSLFHFGGPMAGVAGTSRSSKEETNGGLVSNLPAVQTRSCAKEETIVEEYSLFSARNGTTFSFF
ncbi:uncharacterized protein [Typha latifolia]|uniref:uncharacterized protein isoform X1 n=1 Tax=Typha latifolia TaxID=4733 RepID=UPI003C2FB8D8